MKAESGYALEMLLDGAQSYCDLRRSATYCDGARIQWCNCDGAQIDVRQKCSVVRRSAIERRKRMVGV